MPLSRTTGSVKSREGKLVRVSVYYDPDGKVVNSVMVTGDFFMEPPEALFELMRILKNSKIEEIPEKVRAYFSAIRPLLVGATEDDFIIAFQKAITSDEKDAIP